MNEFIIIKVIPYGGSEKFVHLRWDSVATSDSFIFNHYDTYEQAKSACKSEVDYPIKKLDYKPIMEIPEWNKLQSSYMEAQNVQAC